MAFPPVKEEALKHRIPVFQPATLKTDEAYEILCNLSPECVVVAAYGKILPQRILDLPPYGCVNIHGSLLPAYRGAAPIQWAVLNGDPIAGVTTMQMDAGMDTGDILLTSSCPVPPDMTAGELFDRLSAMGGELIVKTLQGLEQGTVTPVPQDASKATAAPMLDRSMSELDFTRPAGELHNQIRGLNPWPSAKTVIAGKTVKVHASQVLTGGGTPGLLKKGKQLVVQCGNQTALRLTVIQPEGSRAMSDEEWLRGHPLADDSMLL